MITPLAYAWVSQILAPGEPIMYQDDVTTIYLGDLTNVAYMAVRLTNATRNGTAAYTVPIHEGQTAIITTGRYEVAVYYAGRIRDPAGNYRAVVYLERFRKWESATVLHIDEAVTVRLNNGWPATLRLADVGPQQVAVYMVSPYNATVPSRYVDAGTGRVITAWIGWARTYLRFYQVLANNAVLMQNKWVVVAYNPAHWFPPVSPRASIKTAGKKIGVDDAAIDKDRPPRRVRPRPVYDRAVSKE